MEARSFCALNGLPTGGDGPNPNFNCINNPFAFNQHILNHPVRSLESCARHSFRTDDQQKRRTVEGHHGKTWQCWTQDGWTRTHPNEYYDHCGGHMVQQRAIFKLTQCPTCTGLHGKEGRYLSLADIPASSFHLQNNLPNTSLIFVSCLYTAGLTCDGLVKAEILGKHVFPCFRVNDDLI